jgi:hypothetical protein
MFGLNCAAPNTCADDVLRTPWRWRRPDGGGKQPNKQASKQTSKQANKQANKQTT